MKVKGYNIRLKDKWEDITIQDYYNIKDVDNNIQLIAQLSNLSYDEVNDLPIKVIQTLIDQLEFLSNDSETINDTPTSLFSFEDSGGQIHYYKLNLDIPNWKSGRFMEIMELSKDIESVEENLSLLLAIMCDKLTERKWTKKLKVIDRNDRDLIDEGLIILHHCSYVKAQTVLSYFFSHLKDFLKKYSGLFGIRDDITDDIEGDDEFDEGNSFYNDWKWFVFTERVSEVKRITFDEAMNIQTRDYLNTLSYVKSKDDEKERQMKKMRKKLKSN